MIILSRPRWKEVFVDLSDSGSLNYGTLREPINAVGSIPWQNHLKLRFKRGAEHRVILSPATNAVTQKDAFDVPTSLTRGLQVFDYGDADALPLLLGSQKYTSGWTDEGAGKWSRTGINGNSGVVYVSIDGGNSYEPLNQAASEAAMTAGSYYIAKPGGTELFIWLPGGENPNSHIVEVAWTRRGLSLTRTTTFTKDVNVRNLHFRGFSQNSGDWQNTQYGVYRDTISEFCGGNHQSVLLGSGPQIGPGCQDLLFTRNVVRQVQDSGITPQTYANHPNPVIRRIWITHNTIGEGAYGGVEVANWNAAGIIEDIYIEDNTIYKMGLGFSGRAGRTNHCDGVKLIGDTSGTNTTGNIYVRRNTIADCLDNGIQRRTMPGAVLIAERNRISGSPIGIRHQVDSPRNGYIQARFNEISGCGIGIWTQTRGVAVTSDLSKNTIVDCTTGIQTAVAAAVPTIRDNNIANATTAIVAVAGVAPVSNNFDNCTTGQTGGTSSGTNTTNDSGFVDEIGMDYRPAFGSALLASASGLTAGNDVQDTPYLTDDKGCHRGSGLTPITNLLPYPRDFQSWTDVDDCTVVTNEVRGPRGQQQADCLVENDIPSNIHRVRENVSLVTDTVYRFSVRAKAVDTSVRSWIRLEVRTLANTFLGAYYNLATGATGTNNGLESFGTVDLGDGWYECWMDFDCGAGATAPWVQVKIAEANGDTNFTGNGLPSIWLDYAKLYVSPGAAALFGHWVALKDTDGLTELSAAMAEAPEAKVFQWARDWGWFENWDSTNTVFKWNTANLNELQTAAGVAAAAGKKLQIRVQWKQFNAANPGTFWLASNGYTQQYDGVSWLVKLWEPVPAQMFRRLISELATVFADHPGVCGITLQEGSAGIDTFTRSQWVAERVAIMGHASTELPNGLHVILSNSISGTADATYATLSAAIAGEVDELSALGRSNIAYGSTDVLPGQVNIIDNDRQKGQSRRINAEGLNLILLESMQNHDYYYPADGSGTGSKVIGYPPFGGGTYHNPALSSYWAQEHTGASIIMWTRRTSTPGDTFSTGAVPAIAAQPAWVPMVNAVQDENDFTTGNWTKTNVTTGLYSGLDSEDDTNASTLLTETTANATHEVSQSVPLARLTPNVNYTVEVQFASAADLAAVVGGLSRRLRMEVTNLAGTTYAANYHQDIPSAISSDGSPTVRLYQLYNGFWLAQFDFPMGTGAASATVRLLARNVTSNSYAGDDSVAALAIKRVKLFRKIRP